MFGEHSAVNGTNNPYYILVKSKEMQLYRISKESLRSLAALKIDIIGPLRAIIKMKTNWIRFKLQRLPDLEGM